MEDMTLDDLPAYLPWYSEIHTSTTVDVVNYLLSERAAGRTVFYDIYTDAEKAADPSLADTGLFRFAAEGAGGATSALLAGCGWDNTGEEQGSDRGQASLVGVA